MHVVDPYVVLWADTPKSYYFYRFLMLFSPAFSFSNHTGHDKIVDLTWISFVSIFFLGASFIFLQPAVSTL